jgi:hypothetical protein
MATADGDDFLSSFRITSFTGLLADVIVVESRNRENIRRAALRRGLLGNRLDSIFAGWVERKILIRPKGVVARAGTPSSQEAETECRFNGGFASATFITTHCTRRLRQGLALV